MAAHAASGIMAQKETEFLRDNFSDVRFSDGYCFAKHEGSEDTLKGVHYQNFFPFLFEL